jgi:hypothetical protein
MSDNESHIAAPAVVIAHHSGFGHTGGRRGDATTQPWSSGFISCSIVGTNSLTVGWMCIVRAIEV